MGVTTARWAGIALTLMLLSACSDSPGHQDAQRRGLVDGDDKCVSYHEDVAQGSTWRRLRDAMLDAKGWGNVDRIRVQWSGDDIGVSDEEVVRVVDLLNENGRRLVQTEVWRDAGGWRAGVWMQCID